MHVYVHANMIFLINFNVLPCICNSTVASDNLYAAIYEVGYHCSRLHHRYSILCIFTPCCGCINCLMQFNSNGWRKSCERKDRRATMVQEKRIMQ